MSAGTWIVVGGSSAIARAFARRVAAKGCGVLLAGRDLPDLERTAADLRLRASVAVRVVAYDARADGNAAALLAACAGSESPLNLFLAFASMPEQAAVEADARLLADLLRVDFAAPAELLETFAPHFEQVRAGRIVVLGSVSGDRGRRANYAYGAAKAGLATFVEGMGARLAAAGIGVTLVKPGYVDTRLMWGRRGEYLAASPDAVAAAALSAAEAGRAVCYAPRFWRLVMLVIRFMPARLLRRLAL